MSTVPPNPIPFSEPPYLRGLPSPYYTDSHRRFQKACRAFLWENLIKHALEWEREGTVPEHVFDTFCRHHMLIPNLPAPLPVEWLKRLGIHEILGVKVEEWDYLHTGIYCDEVCAPYILSTYMAFDNCTRHIILTYLDGPLRSCRPWSLDDGRLRLWHTTHAPLREPGAPGALPPGLPDGQEADLHRYYGTGGRE